MPSAPCSRCGDEVDTPGRAGRRSTRAPGTAPGCRRTGPPELTGIRRSPVYRIDIDGWASSTQARRLLSMLQRREEVSMNIVRWDPFRELEGIQSRLNRLF